MLNIAKTPVEMHNADRQTYPAPDNYPEILEERNYMAVVPVSDKWGNEYIYDSDGNSYTLERSHD